MKLVRAVMAREGLDWLLCAIGMRGGYATWLSDSPTRRATMIMNILAFPIESHSYFATHGDTIHTTPVDSYGVPHLVSCSQSLLFAATAAPVLIDVPKSSRPRRIGILGKGFMPASAYQTFVMALPGLYFVDAAELIAPIKAGNHRERCGRRGAVCLLPRREPVPEPACGFGAVWKSASTGRPAIGDAAGGPVPHTHGVQ